MSYPVDKNGRNPMENPQLFEGDILGVRQNGNFKAISKVVNLWTDGIIYYKIDDSLTEHLDLIHRTMNHITQRTCITFKMRTNEANYVFVYLGEGCNSYVGRYDGRQDLSLGEGCHYLRTVMHELTHAIGLFHEHNRPDRDQYIKIHFENIKFGMDYQFAKLIENENQLMTAFDFDSIMLYGPTAFSRNGRKTIESIVSTNTVYDHPVDDGYSDGDISIINKLYKCDKM